MAPKVFYRDIIFLLIGKLILLAGLFFTCFSPKTRVYVASSQMEALILNPQKDTSNVRP